MGIGLAASAMDNGLCLATKAHADRNILSSEQLALLDRATGNVDACRRFQAKTKSKILTPEDFRTLFDRMEGDEAFAARIDAVITQAELFQD